MTGLGQSFPFAVWFHSLSPVTLTSLQSSKWQSSPKQYFLLAAQIKALMTRREMDWSSAFEPSLSLQLAVLRIGGAKALRGS